MGQIRLLAAVFTLLVVGGTLGVEPEKPGGSSASPAFYVAVLDVGRVFRECSHFKEQMELLNSDLCATDVVAKRKAEEIQEMARDDPSEQSLVQKAREEFQEEIQAQRKVFLRREAAVYCEVHRDLLRQLEEYCSEKGIVLVLKVGGPVQDPPYFHHYGLDDRKKFYWYTNEITEDILARLNASFAERKAKKIAGTGSSQEVLR